MNYIIITGPTGSGKSKLALSIAKKYNGCIINADSQQILRELPILTDQPIQDASIPMFLYGHKSYLEEYSSFKWCLEVQQSLNVAKQLNKIPIIVGGTGFYINNLINGHFIDVKPNNNLSKKQYFLINGEVLKLLINPDNSVLKTYCEYRIKEMFPRVIDEVSKCAAHLRLKKVIGFHEIRDSIDKNSNEYLIDNILLRTRQYIKRQKTWFKKYCADWNSYSSIDDSEIKNILEIFMTNVKS